MSYIEEKLKEFGLNKGQIESIREVLQNSTYDDIIDFIDE
jgi:hypothetical protein